MGLFQSKADRLYERAKDQFIYRNGGDSAFAEIEQAAEMGSEGAKGFLMEHYARPQSQYHNGAKAAPICEYMIQKHDVPLAKFYLGRLYYFGDGVQQDCSKAYRLFDEAANVRKYRVPQGKGYIGMMHFWGDGVPQSYEEAGKYLGDEFVLGFCDHEWDVMYCYHYMQLYGLGGISQNENEAWKSLREISHRKEPTPRTKKTCMALVCEYTLHQLEEYLKCESPGFESVNECLRDLQTASEGGFLTASCALASFYLRYTYTHTEYTKDYESGKVYIMSEKTVSYEQEANTCLLKVRDQLDGTPMREQEEKYVAQLLKSADKIEKLQPGLSQKLLSYLIV